MVFLIGLYVLLCATVLYSFSLALYRLYFHPLSRFPGPKVAATTKWYEAYFDLFKKPGGLFMFEIERMHEVYGPIVRVNPDELHVKDSEWFEVLYSNASAGTRDKYPPAAHMTGTPDGIFGTISHDVHRRRRAAISPFFSKASVTNYEPRIHDKAELLCRRLKSQISENGIAEMRVNYLALTTDTLFTHAFDGEFDLLGSEQQAINWQRTIRAVAVLTPLAKQFIWIIPLALRSPLILLEAVLPDLARIVKLRRDMSRQAGEAIEEHRLEPTKDEFGDNSNSSRKNASSSRNVFLGMLASSSLPAQDKARERIAQDGFVVLVAGGETTSRVLNTATYHLLANKDTFLVRLKDELSSVMKNPNTRVSLRELEQLPWLTAIIKESLRIMALVTSRLPLVSPTEALQYKEWTIPAGTPVSMTLRDVLLDPAYFPNPHTFTPERWLPSNPDLERISRMYLPFSRGSRMCPGMNFALAELYIVIAYVFRRFDLELYDTIRERDVDVVCDYFIGEVSPESRGIRVKACN